MNIDGPEPAAAARKVVQEQGEPDGAVNDTKADDSRVDGTQVDDTPVDGNQTDGKISAADAARSAVFAPSRSVKDSRRRRQRGTHAERFSEVIDVHEDLRVLSGWRR